jgi:hypothetical protein
MMRWLSDLAARMGKKVTFNPQASPGFKATKRDIISNPHRSKVKKCYKNRPLNMRLFLNFYAKLYSEHAAVLFHRETRLLSR